MNTKPETSQLAGYNYTVSETVAWGDMDAMGHVNNAKYFRYLETARLEFVRQMFPAFAAHGSNSIAEGLALAEIRCRFKVPLTYPDQITIACGIRDIDTSQFLIQSEIYSSKLNCIAAEGDARMVYYDFIKMRKRHIGVDLRTQLEAYPSPDM